jgi:predicted membrane metal-binding protein
MQRTAKLILAAGVLLILLVLSGLHPYHRMTWWLEVAPILAVLPILALTYRRFPLTKLLYALIFLHAVILMVGTTPTPGFRPVSRSPGCSGCIATHTTSSDTSLRVSFPPSPHARSSSAAVTSGPAACWPSWSSR